MIAGSTSTAYSPAKICFRPLHPSRSTHAFQNTAIGGIYTALSVEPEREDYLPVGRSLSSKTMELIPLRIHRSAVNWPSMINDARSNSRDFHGPGSDL